MLRFFWATLCLTAVACGGASVRTEWVGEVTLPGGRSGQALAMFPSIAGLSNLDLSENPDLKLAGYTRTDIAAARVERVRLRIISPVDGGFEFLDSLALNVRSGDSQVKLAEALGITDVVGKAPGPELSLKVLPNANFGGVAQVAPTSFTLEGRGRQPERDYRFEVTVSATFDARK